MKATAEKSTEKDKSGSSDAAGDAAATGSDNGEIANDAVVAGKDKEDAGAGGDDDKKAKKVVVDEDAGKNVQHKAKMKLESNMYGKFYEFAAQFCLFFLFSFI